MRRLVAAVVLWCALGGGAAHAFSGGAPGNSGKSGSTCAGCHGGGAPPTVKITGPTTLSPGAEGSFTFAVTTAAPSRVGIDVAASGGTITKGDGAPPSDDSSGELVSSAPAGPATTFSYPFKLRAPPMPGLVTLFAATAAFGGSAGTAATKLDVMVSPPDLAGIDLAGVDLTIAPSDLSVPPDGAKPPLDEARWGCDCRATGGSAATGGDWLAALGLAAFVLGRRSRRRPA